MKNKNNKFDVIAYVRKCSDLNFEQCLDLLPHSAEVRIKRWRFVDGPPDYQVIIVFKSGFRVEGIVPHGYKIALLDAFLNLKIEEIEWQNDKQDKDMCK